MNVVTNFIFLTKVLRYPAARTTCVIRCLQAEMLKLTQNMAGQREGYH